MVHLAKKRKKEATDKAQAERDATQQAEKQTGKTECGSNKDLRLPSPKTEEEMDEQTEQHGADPQTVSYRIKRP